MAAKHQILDTSYVKNGERAYVITWALDNTRIIHSNVCGTHPNASQPEKVIMGTRNDPFGLARSVIRATISVLPLSKLSNFAHVLGQVFHVKKHQQSAPRMDVTLLTDIGCTQDLERISMVDQKLEHPDKTYLECMYGRLISGHGHATIITPSAYGLRLITIVHAVLNHDYSLQL